MLNEHKDILLVNEMFWFNLMRREMKKAYSNKEKACLVYKKLAGIRNNKKLKSKKVFNEIYKRSKNADEFYIVMMEYLAKYFGKKRWGEKNILIFEDILKNTLNQFPNAKIIYLMRDPRAVINSLNKSLNIFS
ncbi:unnamed protein product [marine sediment metagenome]|uniref:Sulfotransferase domain-containing protein n=1 Tax=marine sediment metagenome TaxID=412755 RepID=X1S6U4_9ZZZZ